MCGYNFVPTGIPACTLALQAYHYRLPWYVVILTRAAEGKRRRAGDVGRTNERRRVSERAAWADERRRRPKAARVTAAWAGERRWASDGGRATAGDRRRACDGGRPSERARERASDRATAGDRRQRWTPGRRWRRAIGGAIDRASGRRRARVTAEQCNSSTTGVQQ